MNAFAAFKLLLSAGDKGSSAGGHSTGAGDVDEATNATNPASKQ